MCLELAILFMSQFYLSITILFIQSQMGLELAILFMSQFYLSITILFIQSQMGLELAILFMSQFYLSITILFIQSQMGLELAILFVTILFIHHNSLYTSQMGLELAILFMSQFYTYIFQLFCVYILQYKQQLFTLWIFKSQQKKTVKCFNAWFSMSVPIKKRLVEYPVSCLNISDGKGCFVLTLLGQQLLHVWKQKAVNRKHFHIQSDTTNKPQRFCYFAQDI